MCRVLAALSLSSASPWLYSRVLANALPTVPRSPCAAHGACFGSAMPCHTEPSHIAMTHCNSSDSYIALLAGTVSLSYLCLAVLALVVALRALPRFTDTPHVLLWSDSWHDQPRSGSLIRTAVTRVDCARRTDTAIDRTAPATLTALTR